MVRHAATSAGAEGILAPDVLRLPEGSRRIETATGKHELAVEPGFRIL